MNGIPTLYPRTSGRFSRKERNGRKRGTQAFVGRLRAEVFTFSWGKPDNLGSSHSFQRPVCCWERTIWFFALKGIEKDCAARPRQERVARLQILWTKVRVSLTAGCFFRNVLATTALPHNPEDGIINILRPVHDVEIELRGGIRIERSKWLNGHPPQVRLRGDHDNLDLVIDQQSAICDPDNIYTVPGWDSLGVHRVFCGGATASYELVNAPSQWDSFPAFTHLRTAIPNPVHDNHLWSLRLDGETEHRAAGAHRKYVSTWTSAWSNHLYRTSIRFASTGIFGLCGLSNRLGGANIPASGKERNQHNTIASQPFPGRPR